MTAMDAVITYVDGQDPSWRADYEKYVGKPLLEKRFRDWGTLKYLLRGIETRMPFVRNVFLVVSSESQIPNWADTENLHIVLHRDIIPEDLLPVFNSCTIEMFLHRIPNLAEEFLYFNDDMFPLLPCESTDFFRDGRGVIGISRHLLSRNMYKDQCRAASDMARKALGMRKSPIFIRPQHIPSPMLLSSCKMAFKVLEKDILATASRLRTSANPNQYLYVDYMYFSGKIIPERVSNKHISQKVWSGEKIADYILNPKSKFACINDVEMPDEKYLTMRDAIIKAFEKRFPKKSRFES